MSIISQQTTAVTGATITAAVWNDEWSNLLDDYNGSITNANISATAAIAESKLTFSGSGHGHTGGTDGKEISTNRGFTWGIAGTLTVANEQSMKYVVPQTLTSAKLWAYTDSGTCTIRIQKDTKDVGTLEVTGSVGSTTSFSSAGLTAGQTLTLDITAISSGS